MSYEMKENSGSLFVNDNKRTDRHPDYSGRVLVDGKKYFISSWKKTTKNGAEYFSLSFTPISDRPVKIGKKEEKPVEDGAPFSDEIPF